MLSKSVKLPPAWTFFSSAAHGVESNSVQHTHRITRGETTVGA